MKSNLNTSILIFMLILAGFKSHGQNNDYLIRFRNMDFDQYGYKNMAGDTIISLGKYSIIFTDTFKTYAVVLKPHCGFVAIDRNEEVMFEIFPFDNGPDITSEGLFRIIENGKIGYADSLSGKIVIQPQFDCAWPFKNGVAKVSNNCETERDGEHFRWLSDNWFYIDKSGNKVKKIEGKK